MKLEKYNFINLIASSVVPEKSFFFQSLATRKLSRCSVHFRSIKINSINRFVIKINVYIPTMNCKTTCISMSFLLKNTRLSYSNLTSILRQKTEPLISAKPLYIFFIISLINNFVCNVLYKIQWTKCMDYYKKENALQINGEVLWPIFKSQSLTGHLWKLQ